MPRSLRIEFSLNMADENIDENPHGEDIAERSNQLMLSRHAAHGRYTNATGMALRARQQIINEEIARERFGFQQQNLELQRVKELVSIAKQTAVVQRQMQAEQHTVNALNGIGELDHKDPNYTRNLAKIFAENPLAAKDPVIQDIVRSQIASKKVVDDANMAMYKEEGLEKIRNQAALDKEKLLMDSRAETAGKQQAAKLKASEEDSGYLSKVPAGIQETWAALQAEMKHPQGADEKEKKEYNDIRVDQAAALEKLHPQLNPEKTGWKPPNENVPHGTSSPPMSAPAAAVDANSFIKSHLQ